MRPDLLIASWGEALGTHTLTPEQNMLLAVVERAILDYVGPAKTPAKYKRDAENFFLCKDKEEWSFLWIADHLPFDPQWFARVILTYVRGERDKYLKARAQRLAMLRCGNVTYWKDEGE